MLDLITAFICWIPVVPRTLIIIVLVVLIVSVLVNLIIKIIDMIPFA